MTLCARKNHYPDIFFLRRSDQKSLSGRRRSMSRGRWGRIYRPGDRGLTNGRRGEGAGAEVVGVAAAGVFALLAAEKIPLALGLDGRLAVWIICRLLNDIPCLVDNGGVVALPVGDIVSR